MEFDILFILPYQYLLVIGRSLSCLSKSLLSVVLLYF